MWDIVQTIILLLTVIFIAREVRMLRNSNMLQSLDRLREYWNSDKMMQYRKITCLNFKSGKRSIALAEGEVLGFFEEIGLLWKKKVINLDFIWETYAYFIEHYWSMMQRNVQEYRDKTGDKSWYENFEQLCKALQQYSKKRGCPTYGKNPKEIEDFIVGELGLENDEARGLNVDTKRQ